MIILDKPVVMQSKEEKVAIFLRIDKILIEPPKKEIFVEFCLFGIDNELIGAAQSYLLASDYETPNSYDEYFDDTFLDIGKIEVIIAKKLCSASPAEKTEG